jgi:small subunit ribosomal protein S5
LIKVPLTESATLPHTVIIKFKAAQILMKPAAPGTGLIAGGGVRSVLEMAGVKDVLAKSLGSSNVMTVVQATINGLMELRDPKRERERRLAAVGGRG